MVSPTWTLLLLLLFGNGGGSVALKILTLLTSLSHCSGVVVLAGLTGLKKGVLKTREADNRNRRRC